MKKKKQFPCRINHRFATITGLTLVLSSSMSNFAASDISPLMVLVNFLGDPYLSSRNPPVTRPRTTVALSLAIRTGLPPTVDPDRAFLPPEGGAPCLLESNPGSLKVLSCLGRVRRLTTPPRPTFRVTFLLGDGSEGLLWPDVRTAALLEAFDCSFLVVSTTFPLVVLVMVMPPPFVVFTSSC